MAERITITPDMTTGELHDRLAPLGADLMARALAALARGSLRFQAQPAEGVTYAKKIEKAECRIDWSADSHAVHDHIRGLSPFPGAFFEADFGRGPERIKVLGSRKADGVGSAGTVLDTSKGVVITACGSGAVALTRLQRAGKPALDVAEFLRGTPMIAGMQLTSAST
jgi:methionyl-tRNA formyltransferase